MVEPNDGASRKEHSRRWRSSRKTRWALRIGLLAAIAVLAVHYFPRLGYWLHHESTDDAYVHGTIVTVSPQVAGKVLQVAVDDNEDVTSGQLLLIIDPRDYQAKLAQEEARASMFDAQLLAQKAKAREQQRAIDAARAQVALAKAQAQLAKKDLLRARNLLRHSGATRSDYDEALARLRVTEAEVRTRRAALAQAAAALASGQANIQAKQRELEAERAAVSVARLNLERTRVVAPSAGRVTNKVARAGEVVQPGQVLLSLVDLRSIYVLANFKESQIKSISVGQSVDVHVDAYPKHTFKGRVDSFQAGTGSVFSLLPPENATGNFVKVVQRIPVKIRVRLPPPGTIPLYPGLSVVPHVDTRAHPGEQLSVPAVIEQSGP